MVKTSVACMLSFQDSVQYILNVLINKKRKKALNYEAVEVP